LRWLFRIPRHHAEQTKQARARKQNPHQADRQLAFDAMKAPAQWRRSSTARPARHHHQHRRGQRQNGATAPATRPDSSSSPSATRRAYTGMKDAESTPSPNRFAGNSGCGKARVEGIRRVRQTKVVPEDALAAPVPQCGWPECPRLPETHAGRWIHAALSSPLTQLLKHGRWPLLPCCFSHRDRACAPGPPPAPRPPAPPPRAPPPPSPVSSIMPH